MVIITKNISEQDNDISSQLSHPFKSYFFKKMVMSGIGHKQPCFTYLPTFSAMLLFLFLLFSPVAGYTVESIKVGVLHSLTGPMASKEKVLKDTLLMLIDEVNKKGGILGKRLVPVVVDPASKPALFEEKARQLMEDERVDVIFGCWDSAARKAVLPVLEELNGLLFYPARHEGQESSKYVFYTGGVPNQQAIPAVSYLMNEVGVQRWVLIGSNALYPRTINKILSLYLKGQGVSSRDMMIKQLSVGETHWGRLVSDIRGFRQAGNKIAIIANILGNTSIGFYRELARQGLMTEDIPVVAFSIGENDLYGVDVKPLVGQLAVWNYFMSVDAEANDRFKEMWLSYTKDQPPVINDPMEATYIGFSMWINAVRKARTTRIKQVRAAMYGIEVPNLTGGTAKMLPNHHITKPAFIGEIQGDGKIKVRWSSEQSIPGDAWADDLPGGEYLISNWQDEKIDCGKFNTKTNTCNRWPYQR